MHWLCHGKAVMKNTSPSATADAFARVPLPKRFCNLDRLLHAMKARGLDGIVATAPWNVFYLTAFNGIAHKSDEPRPYVTASACPTWTSSNARLTARRTSIGCWKTERWSQSICSTGRRARAVLAGGGGRHRKRRRQTAVLVGICTADAGRLNRTKSLEHGAATCR